MYNEDGVYEGFKKYGPKPSFNAPSDLRTNEAPSCQRCGKKPMVSTGMCTDCETKAKTKEPAKYK